MNEREIFERAIEVHQRSERDAFLSQACGDDAALRKRLDELLESHDQASGFLNVPVVEQIPSSRPSGFQPTIDLSPAKGATGADVAPEEDGDEALVPPYLSYLHPSNQPGSIGRLGHYEILQVLGQGAFGIVFKAFDEKLHRHVAIKAMNPLLASTSPPRKRFLREARSVAAIKHENIVQVHSVEEQPLPYLAMEFVDGVTLHQKLDGAGPLEVPEILHLGRQMAAGLAAAHEKGLIHRDIKPGNILLEAGAEQKVKITDFGLARAADDASITRTGTIAGTPMYMAPEQALGKTLDHRADLFSLGSVLYQMTCGRPPFRGANALAVLKRVIDETPRSVQDILPEVPEWLCMIIEKLHAKNPKRRYQTAKEVADLLARCHNELQATGKVSCVPLRVKIPNKRSTTTTTVDATPASPASNPASRSNRTPVISAAIILLALGGLIVTELTGITSFVWKPGSELKPGAGIASSGDTATANAATTQTTGWHSWPADAPKPAIAPFTADEAKKHQEAWAAYLQVPVEYENSIGMKFRLIPPGEFLMGSTEEQIRAALPDAGDDALWRDCIKSEGPQHVVVITRPFYIGVHEVTQGQFQQATGTNPSYFAASGEWATFVMNIDTVNLPVEGVSWVNATDFCHRLNEMGKFPAAKLEKQNATVANIDSAYRLPLEAEWEFACRAGTSTQFSTGSTSADLTRAGWWTNSSERRTHAVGELQSNSFGLYDLHGNVWEWVWDAWNPQWYSTLAGRPAVNPFNPPVQESERMARGGNYSSGFYACRSGSRCSESSSYSATRIGFRVALSIDAVRQAHGVSGQ